MHRVRESWHCLLYMQWGTVKFSPCVRIVTHNTTKQPSIRNKSKSTAAVSVLCFQAACCTLRFCHSRIHFLKPGFKVFLGRSLLRISCPLYHWTLWFLLLLLNYSNDSPGNCLNCITILFLRAAKWCSASSWESGSRTCCIPCDECCGYTDRYPRKANNTSGNSYWGNNIASRCVFESLLLILV